MILEGFEIENFSCIKRLAVDGLPPTGVIVLHGLNGTGKSSILEALRACLMDNKSTSKALARGFPKNSNEKPRITVIFRAAGTTWKIMKQFNSRDSTLHSRTSTGQWKLETADPSEAHERTCQLVGGSNSKLGLTQLLWLTQTEFILPDSKKFDSDVQSQLRGVLGVLQTPLDDRFLGRVKEAWSHWFAARSKPGEKPKLKKECSLAQTLATLEQQRAELLANEVEFQGAEKLMDSASDLEIRASDLRRQLAEATRGRDLLQTEYEQSLRSLEVHRLAAERVTACHSDLTAALTRRDRRADSERRLHDADRAASGAQQLADQCANNLGAAATGLRCLRVDMQALRETARALQSQRDAVGMRLNRLALREQAIAANAKLIQADRANRELDDLKQQARDHPAPDGEMLHNLAQNRMQADDLRAELRAAAIRLTLTPDARASAPLLAVDGTPAAVRPLDDAPLEVSVRRRAEIALPGWGRILVTRGEDVRTLDQIEAEVERLDQAFADALAPFGVSPSHLTPLERLRELAAEKKLRDPEIERKQRSLAQVAPQGLEPLRQEAARLENLRAAGDAGEDSLIDDAISLTNLADELNKDLVAIQDRIDDLDKQIDEVECQIEGTDSKAKTSGMGKAGLRQKEAAAKDALTTLNATADSIRAELDRMLTAEQIADEIQAAEDKLACACNELKSAKLSDSEETVSARVEAAKDGVRALDSHLKHVEKDFNLISGQLRSTAGLHQKRAAAAARVEELERQTQRELLESEAFDRLYALFEECREKQLGTVMGPIHDRVLRWMKLLRITGYQSIRFNDQFLPEKLITRESAAEFTLADESTGTMEQLGLMVRLALGATLSKPEDPVVAMLDDPLTHSDPVRLDRMRAVLRNAAAGEAASGPLQIFVLTCHPEWFDIDGATIIDLGKPNVLIRNPNP